jgi:hypothetical protein
MYINYKVYIYINIFFLLLNPILVDDIDSLKLVLEIPEIVAIK